MNQTDPIARRPPPGQTLPASDLRLLEDFVNTKDVESGDDALGTPALLGSWLAERGLVGPERSITSAEHRQAISIREGIRALARANNGEPLDRDLVASMGGALSRLPVTVSVNAEDWRLAPGRDGIDAFFAQLLTAMVRAMADGSWARVKACQNDACRWLFYDRSRNRSGTWCQMAVCGSRMKARAYRARQRAAAG